MSRSGKKWLNAEVDYLKENYALKSVEDIAAFLDRDVSAVKSRAGVLKLTKKKLVKDFHDEILKLAKAELTVGEVAKKLGFSDSTIFQYGKEHNIRFASDLKTNVCHKNGGIDKKQLKVDFDTITFSDWFTYWYQTYRMGKLAEETRMKYRSTQTRIASHPLGKKKLKEIAREDVQKYVDWYGKDHAKQTVNDHMQFIRSAFQDAIIDGHISSNPAVNVQLVFKEQRLSISEQKAMRDKKKWLEVDEYMKFKYSLLFDLKKSLLVECEAVSQNTNQIVEILLFVALKTGARLGEILGITFSDVDFHEKFINIDKSWDYKKHNGGSFKPTKNTASIRRVPVDQETLDILKMYFSWLNTNHVETKEETIFNVAGSDIYNSTINAKLAKLLKELEIEPISIHKLRHTQASLLIAKDVPLQVIAKRLGHTDTNMIQRVYGHLLKQTEERGNRMVLEAI
ncbi:site-specific integrase [Enterococcus dispar]|uniref:tyrosine-type recombinase/integrase n=1 Tax=Enterococcus dispar TaxID=44009 RepID=UPI00232FE3ED|nr:site-specific integrase [Enterococcus dispar]WCG32970.1 site-specific integrase [Enterococcus dispar]